MPRVMIVGANRGIGRALLDGYLEKGWECIATSRKEQDAEDDVTWIKLDVRNPNLVLFLWTTNSPIKRERI